MCRLVWPQTLLEVQVDKLKSGKYVTSRKIIHQTCALMIYAAEELNFYL